MLLLIGASGQLGRELRLCFPDALCPTSTELNIASNESVRNYVARYNIGAIVNCGAYTSVEDAETEVDKAFAVNALGAENLAKTGIPLIQVSTDYVFDGKAYKPYIETDKANPLSVYGRSKLAGEKAVLEHASAAIIVRTSWIYSVHGKNFLKTIRQMVAHKDSINVVCDQIGTPTYAEDLASVIARLVPYLKSGEKEIYNYTNEGVCSWYDFAYYIAMRSNSSCYVSSISSEDYPTKAQRPLYSVLNKEKIKSKLGFKIPHWMEGVDKCLKQFS